MEMVEDKKLIKRGLVEAVDWKEEYRLLFAACRVPSDFQEIFNDEKFIENLIKSRKISPKQKTPHKEKEASELAEIRATDIEDELL